MGELLPYACFFISNFGMCYFKMSNTSSLITISKNNKFTKDETGIPLFPHKSLPLRPEYKDTTHPCLIKNLYAHKKFPER
jgi:hypothetical protein